MIGKAGRKEGGAERNLSKLLQNLVTGGNVDMSKHFILI